MATNVEEFEEILNAEQKIDMEKLCLASSHGIPDNLRGAVWSQLLRLKHIETHSILNTNADHSEFIRKLRSESARYCRRSPIHFSDKQLQYNLEQTLVTFLSNNQGITYKASLIALCAPFVLVFKNDTMLAYLALGRLLDKISSELIDKDEWLEGHDSEQQISNFLMLFRLLMPELYNHFQDEEVDTKEWVQSWLETLLSKQLPIECILRLWDTYFSSENGLQLHIYVCLAILYHCKEDLEDLEQSDIDSFLHRLPHLDMEIILTKAFQIKSEFAKFH